jgi:hypothetical protein
MDTEALYAIRSLAISGSPAVLIFCLILSSADRILGLFPHVPSGGSTPNHGSQIPSARPFLPHFFIVVHFSSKNTQLNSTSLKVSISNMLQHK